MIKTRLQLVCCALVWEPGCLVISGSRKEGVSGMDMIWDFSRLQTEVQTT